MSKNDTQAHQHIWVNDKCDCGMERMTWAEANRRKAIWNKYYGEVKNTEAYSLYQTQKAAFKDKDMELVKEIAERQKEKRLNQE